MPEPEPEKPKTPPWMKALLGGIVAGNVADMWTTEQALGRGYQEQNPIMSSSAARYGLKSAFTAGELLAAIRLWNSGHKKAAVAVGLLGTAIPTAAAIHNYREMKGGR